MLTVRSTILLELLSVKLDETDISDPKINRAIQVVHKKGQQLRKRQAMILEGHLDRNPSDITLRLALIGFYESRHVCTVSYREPYSRHLLWFIQNVPKSRAATGPYNVDDEYYRRLRLAWLQQVRAHPDSAVLLDHAATFCYIFSDKYSERFWKRAQQIEPHNPMWPYNLARLYKTSIEPTASRRRNKLLATKAMREWCKVRALPSGYPEQNYLSPALIERANTEFEQLARAYGLSW
jgi:hypothetical protein